MKKNHDDRRVKRTRTALIDAFNRLILSDRKKEIRVSDIVAQANVGRSTFYEHYSSADDIHMQALARPLSILADAAAGNGDPQKLQKLLEHFWENRSRARVTFGEKYERAARLLAQLTEEKLSTRNASSIMPTRLAALHLAEGPLRSVQGWLLAQAPCSAEDLANAICVASRAAAAALYADAGSDGEV